MKSCFFIGHRDADERLLPRLEMVVDRLIREENVRYFYVGGYGGFDRVAAAAVRHMKQKYPDITLMLVCRIILLNAPQRLPTGLMGHITLTAWKARQNGTQSCVPIGSWLMPATG